MGNMMVISKVSTVSKYLENPNIKFNATRALLLVGQGQMMALKMACDGTKEEQDHFKKIMAVAKKRGVNVTWQFNDDQARLLNSNLLVWECALIIFVNRYLFQADRQTDLIKARQVIDFKSDKS